MKGEFGKETWPQFFDEPVPVVCDRRPYRSGALPPPGAVGRTGLSKTLAIYWRFLLAGLLHRTQTGSVVPSQRFLINQMLAPVPPIYAGQIIELGAGTGALTRRLAARCPRASVLACEINPHLARDLEHNLAAAALGGRVEVICDSAEHLLARRQREGSEPPDFIFSGIPIGNLGRDAVLALITAIRRALAPGGMYIQFQYSLLDRKKIKSKFSKLRTVPAFLNFPPAFVYYAQK
jgi:phospholipid N-methyltransferase